MGIAGITTGLLAEIDWGPMGAWAGAIATVLVVIITCLVAMGYFDRFVAPELTLTFEGRQPWCRHTTLEDGTGVLWVRVAVENSGRNQAEGCVGRLLSAATDGELRDDVDPVQLRWAGVPHSRAFDPIDIRPGQREYLDILRLPDGEPWRLVTFEEPDFDAGFVREFTPTSGHQFEVAVFTANGSTASLALTIASLPGDAGPVMEMKPNALVEAASLK